MVQNKKPKEEITLTDDEPRLVKLMIDYFYQLDYDDRPQVTAMATTPRMTLNRAKSPESPVGQKVGYFESLGRTKDAVAGPEEEPPAAEDAVNGAPVDSIPEPATIDEFPPATEEGSFWNFKSTKKGKKKRKIPLLGDDFPPPEPARESSPSPVSETKALRHSCSDESDSEIDNTELGINALMYALADKYG
jgi:hypothetical protein